MNEICAVCVLDAHNMYKGDCECGALNPEWIAFGCGVVVGRSLNVYLNLLVVFIRLNILRGLYENIYLHHRAVREQQEK